MTRQQAIRQWWYLYALILKPGCPEHLMDEFKAHDKTMEGHGITGRIPRDGAEDLAAEADRIRNTKARGQ